LRVLEQDPRADVAMAGFPANWREAELQVCLSPVCDCSRLSIVKDTSGVAVCLLQTRRSSVPALLVARLRSSNLAREGLRVALASRKDAAHQVPKSFLQHQFQAEERGALHGLRSQTDLNGSPCTVVRYDQDSGRWLVRLDIASEDNEILVSAANLLPLWSPEQADSAAEEVADKEDMAEKAPENGGTQEDAELVEDEAVDRGNDMEGVEDHATEAPEEDGQGKAKKSDLEEADAAAASAPKAEPKGKVKMSHALVVTGFPLWDLQRINQYFARFGELRTILGANKTKGGKRKLLVVYVRKVNAKKSQQHVHGAEIDGHELSAVFADDSMFAKQQAAKAASRPKKSSD